MKLMKPTALFGAIVVSPATRKIDHAPILREAKKIGIKWYFIEDESPSSGQQVPQSIHYPKTVKW
jgi:hypothetical protein